jgi:hypothetical protein
MLVEEEIKGCTLPDILLYRKLKKRKMQMKKQLVDIGDGVSCSENSDGEADTIRRKKHKVYDDNVEVHEFKIRQAFSDSGQFKQTLINYGVDNFHHYGLIGVHFDVATRVGRVRMIETVFQHCELH